MSRLLTKLLPRPLKGGLVPSLDLDFVRNRYQVRDSGLFVPREFNQTLTFARDSLGYDITKNDLVSYPANTPRLSERGLAVYGLRANLLPSDAVSTTAGVVKATGSTATLLNERAYVADTTSVINHYVATALFSAAAGTAYSFTIYLRAGTSRYVRIWPSQVSNWGGFAVAGLKVDLQLGRVVVKGTALTNVSVTLLKSGVAVVTFSAVPTVTGNAGIGLSPTTASADFADYTFAGDGVAEQYYYLGTVAEAAQSPSGYIPPGTTRPAESCAIIVKNLADGGWFNPDAGTSIVEISGYDTPVSSSTRRILEFSNTAFTTRIVMGVLNAEAYIGIVSNSVTLRGLQPPIGNGRLLMSVGYDSNGVTAKANSGAEVTATGVLTNDINTAYVGRSRDASSSYILHGYISRIRYYPRRLTQSIINALHLGA